MTLHRHRILLVAFGVVAAALLAVVLARAILLEWTLRTYLARSGDQSAELRVLGVGLNRTTVTGVETKWLRAERITVRYGLSDLLKARVALVEIDGLAVDLDFTTQGAEPAFEFSSVPPIALSEAVIFAKTPLGPVEVTAEGRTGPQGQGALLADLDLRGVSDFGAFEGRFSGVLGAEGLQMLDLGLQASAPQLLGRALGQTDIELELKDAKWSARFHGRTADGKAEVDLRGSAAGGEVLRDIVVDVDARAAGGTAVLQQLAPAPLDAEEIRVQVSMTAARLPPDEFPATSGGWVEAFSNAGVSAAVAIEVRELHLPASGRLVSTAGRVTVTSETNGLIVTLPEDLVVFARTAGEPPVAAPRPDLAWPEVLAEELSLRTHGQDKAVPLSLRLQATGDGGATLAYEGTVRLSASQDQQMWLAARGEAHVAPGFDGLRFRFDQTAVGLLGVELPGLEIEKARFEGAVAGDSRTLTVDGDFNIATPEFRLGDFLFRGPRLSAPVAAVFEDGELRLSVTKAGELRWRQASVEPGILRMPDDFAVAIAGVEARVRGGKIAYETRLEAARFKLSFGDQPKLVEVELQPRPVTVKGRWSPAEGNDAEVDFGFDQIDLPRLGISADGLRGREVYSPQGGQERMTLSIAKVRSSRSPPLFGPFSLHASIDHSGTDIRAQAAGSMPAGGSLFRLEALHSRRTNAGNATIVLDPPLAATERLALKAIFPAAGDLVMSHGEITGSADLSWTQSSFRGRSRLRLAEVSLVSDQISVEKLAGEIVFDSLFPPRTRIEQRLTAGRIVAGQQLEDLEITFLVSPMGPKQDVGLKILEATGTSAFGSLALQSGTVIPERRFYDLPIRVADLDLKALSDWASIEGLEVTGYLSGLIPLRVEDGGISLADAVLDNTGEGRIAFRSQVAARALAAGGEPVELMLRALEDFGYEELRVTAETHGDEETIELLISTLGSNPEVLDGHPFQFNIRLTGNLPQLVDIFGQGGEVASEVLGRMWRLGP